MVHDLLKRVGQISIFITLEQEMLHTVDVFVSECRGSPRGLLTESFYVYNMRKQVHICGYTHLPVNLDLYDGTGDINGLSSNKQ